MSSGVDDGDDRVFVFLRAPGAAYEQEAPSPRLMQFSQGDERLHFNLPDNVNLGSCDSGKDTDLRLRHGAHDNGTRFRFLTTR